MDQFSDMLGPLVLTDTQASEVMTRLAERHKVSAKRTDAERQSIAIRLGQIDTWTEQAYQDRLNGSITVDRWKSLSRKWETEQIQLRSQLEVLNGNGPDILFTAGRILELAQRLPDLWLRRNNGEKRELIDLLYSNCTLDGATLSAAYKKPFSIIAEGTQTQKWRGGPHSPQTFVRFEFPVRFGHSSASGSRGKTLDCPHETSGDK